MAEPFIKQDPDSFLSVGASPSGFTDDDIYEDAGDLEFGTDPRYQQVFVARLPQHIWDKWEQLDDDAEIRIGTIRRQIEKDAKGNDKEETLKMLLSPLGIHQDIPKEYKLETMSTQVDNTFIFTEQDLPGFKSKSRQKFDPTTANMPKRLTKPKFDKPAGIEKKPWDKNKKFQPYYMKAIPKKTTLVGRVSTELNCVAADTEQARRLLAERTFKQMTAKKPMTFLRGAAGDISQAGVHAGSVRDAAVFGNFIRNIGTVKGKSKQDTKFARLPQNELFDALFRCFRKYNFWSMKALRSELQQPEAYLRESLEKIADMPRSGRFAMLWTLKPENKVANFDGMDDAAPEGADIPEDDDGEEEDEEDMKLEDVNF